MAPSRVADQAGAHASLSRPRLGSPVASDLINIGPWRASAQPKTRYTAQLTVPFRADSLHSVTNCPLIRHRLQLAPLGAGG
jgi:hypothetical protein